MSRGREGRSEAIAPYQKKRRSTRKRVSQMRTKCSLGGRQERANGVFLAGGIRGAFVVLALQQSDKGYVKKVVWDVLLRGALIDGGVDTGLVLRRGGSPKPRRRDEVDERGEDNRSRRAARSTRRKCKGSAEYPILREEKENF